MKRFANILAAIAAMAAAGCTLNTLQTEPFLNKEIKGDDFNAHLARAYQKRAAVEATVDVEWTHAARFADKGRDASKGELVLPWIAGDWNVKPIDQLDLIVSRARLMDALNLGGRTVNPQACAAAQVRYDGWLEQSHDNDIGAGGFGAVQQDRVAAEKEAFMKAMPLCEYCVGVTADSLARDFIIYFGFDKFDLTPQARETVNAIAEHLICLRDEDAIRIEVVGHADRSGPERYNQGLSSRRASVISQALGGRGVPVDMVDWRGETEPAKPTPDGVREPLNRRVHVRVTADISS